MLSLIYKDFLLQRSGKSIIYMLVLPVLASFTASGHIIYAVLPFIAGSYLYIVYANALDDKYKAEKTLAAMPVGRNTIVEAKYLGVTCYLAAFFVTAAVISVIISFFSEGMALESTFGISSLVQYIIIAAVYYGVFFPIYFKVGYQRSRWANYISLLIAAGIFIMATRGLSSLTGIDFNSLQGALSYLTHIGPGLWNILLPAISVLIIAVSMHLSKIFYSRREF